MPLLGSLEGSHYGALLTLLPSEISCDIPTVHWQLLLCFKMDIHGCKCNNIPYRQRSSGSWPTAVSRPFARTLQPVVHHQLPKRLVEDTSRIRWTIRKDTDQESSGLSFLWRFLLVYLAGWSRGDVFIIRNEAKKLLFEMLHFPAGFFILRSRPTKRQIYWKLTLRDDRRMLQSRPTQMIVALHKPGA